MNKRMSKQEKRPHETNTWNQQRKKNENQRIKTMKIKIQTNISPY